MIPLPQCRWRGVCLGGDEHMCLSRRLPVPTPVNCRLCQEPDHECAGPSLLKQIAKFGWSAVKHAVNGFGVATEEEYAARLKICEGCTSCDSSEAAWKCLECGCQLKDSELWPGKASWKSESCPKGLWPKLSLPTISPSKPCGGCNKTASPPNKA